MKAAPIQAPRLVITYFCISLAHINIFHVYFYRFHIYISHIYFYLYLVYVFLYISYLYENQVDISAQIERYLIFVPDDLGTSSNKVSVFLKKQL